MTTHERAVEVDTALAELYGIRGQALYRLIGKLDHVHFQLGERKGWGRDAWPTNHKEAEELLRTKLTDGSLADRPWQVREFSNTLDALDRERETIAAAEEAMRPFQQEYNAERWSRFFLVQASNGHIHSSMSCATTFPTTEWAWLPDLSGLDEEVAVAEHGPRLCSVCFPSAPIEWTLGLPKSPRCPGSGAQVVRIGRSRYGLCPTCGKSFALSSMGAVRAHKPAA